jgi:DNA-binding transcriptional LysR family regulator
MEPTEAARELVPLVEEVLEAAGRLEQRARMLRQPVGEALTIGLNTEPGFLKVGEINRRLSSLHGELNVVFVASQSALAAPLLHHGQVDLAFFFGELDDPAIQSSRLAEARFCVVIPAALRKRDGTLGWEDLAGLPWIWVERASPPYEAMRRQFDERGLVPSVAVQAVDEYIVRELVAAGLGVAVMREDEARPLLQEKRAVIWEKGWQSQSLSLGWLARREATRKIRIARAAIEYLWRRHESLSDDPLARIIY